MGVRYLETYMHKKASQSCRAVYIRDLIEDHNKETGKRAEILVDGMCFVRHIVKESEWYYGGQLLELEEDIESFVHALKEYGAEPVLFIDGTTPDYKIKEWVRRQSGKYRSASTVFKELETTSRSNSRNIILPPNAVHVMRHTFSSLGCKIISSKNESDRCIAEYALRNGSMAIISQDSDFVVYNTSKYYLSLKYCDFNNLKTIQYETDALIKKLQIQPHHMALLACLAGNDRIPKAKLHSFHREIGFLGTSNGVDFEKLASYVSKYSPPPELFREVEFISFDVFKDASMTDEIHEVLSDYLLTPHENESRVAINSQSDWEKIILLCDKLKDQFLGFNQIHNVMSLRTFSLGVCLENMTVESCSSITSQLRRRWYGILFYECPETLVVKENIFSGGFESISVHPKLPSVEHPGLEVLWLSNDEVFVDIRWDLIGWVFDFNDKKCLKKVPLKYLVPLLTARFLHRKKGDLFDEVVINALFATAVCLQDHTPNQIKKMKLPHNPLVPEAVTLYTIITTTFSFVILILQTVGIASLREIRPTYYQDGKLFQMKYINAKEGNSIWDLSNRDERNYKEITALNYIVAEHEKSS